MYGIYAYIYIYANIWGILMVNAIIYIYIYIYIAYMDPMGNWLVVTGTWLLWLSISSMSSSPTDELHHFSRWLLHHQPAKEDLKIHGLVFRRSVRNCWPFFVLNQRWQWKIIIDRWFRYDDFPSRLNHYITIIDLYKFTMGFYWILPPNIYGISHGI